MKSILDKLHKDHKNISKLLSFLEHQLYLLGKCENFDLSTTLDAIKYMKEYPDNVHHPLENIVFKYFLDHHEQAREEITELLHEHEGMPILTENLLRVLEGALADVPQKREELCSCLKKYISIQKEHMQQEEAYVYPILNSILDENDWEKIDSELAHIEDPLFGKSLEKTYQGLLLQIIS
jgi:hemerythrin-like domain-containing protein